jgi:adenine/guanine phosphoribosyltransferase-like PRPP-binding protein
VAPLVFVLGKHRPAPPIAGTTLVLVIDDVIASGTTMRLARDAVRATGVMAFRFAYSGH